MIKVILASVTLGLILYFAIVWVSFNLLFDTMPYIPKLPSGYSMYVNEFDDYKFVDPDGYTSETYDNKKFCINAAIDHYKENHSSNIIWRAVD
ncbi:MAG: hypothetical protein WC119_00175 [Synergistaceae bacterium]